MTDAKTMLCIGGPLGGQRYAASSGSGFSVPVAPYGHAAGQYGPNAIVEFEILSYREEIFHTPEVDISFWVPRDQTALQTMTLLFEAYVAMMARPA